MSAAMTGDISPPDRTAARVGIAGPNTWPIIETAVEALGLGSTGALRPGRNGALDPSARPGAPARSRVGIAGNVWSVLGTAQDALGIAGKTPRAVPHAPTRVADRAAHASAQALWFADYSYIVRPGPGGMEWRSGRTAVFGPHHRAIPLYLDSSGYRARLVGTAPAWARSPDAYKSAIALTEPDGYAAADEPHDRRASMDNLLDLMEAFPGDIERKLWPVYHPRWLESGEIMYAGTSLPAAWRRLPTLAALVPRTRTQRAFSAPLVEAWARRAVATALAMARDPVFRWMMERFGRAMVGGLVGYRAVPRPVRHILAGMLLHQFPDGHVWLLGQASNVVINGLGMLGLLERTWSDSTWKLLDANAERIAVYEDRLITMIKIGRGLGPDGRPLAQTFFTRAEAIRANLRSITAPYAGLLQWPDIAMTVDTRDEERLAELKRACAPAQLPLWP